MKSFGDFRPSAVAAREAEAAAAEMVTLCAASGFAVHFFPT
eukprot:gene36962-41842_t